jgi:prolyl 4-hydroxylase
MAELLITAKMRHWVVPRVEAGCRPEEVVVAMRGSGWDKANAVAAMGRVLAERLDEIAAESRAAGSPRSAGGSVPELDLSQSRPLVVADGHQVKVVATLPRPCLVVFRSLLTETDCDALVELALPHLVRRETVDTSTGGSEVNVARTSEGMFFSRGEMGLIARIERRIGKLLRRPVERGEELQVLRYRPGAKYRPHHDYFVDSERPGTRPCGRAVACAWPCW